jgi:hypothetical protein
MIDAIHIFSTQKFMDENCMLHALSLLQHNNFSETYVRIIRYVLLS